MLVVYRGTRSEIWVLGAARLGRRGYRVSRGNEAYTYAELSDQILGFRLCGQMLTVEGYGDRAD